MATPVVIVSGRGMGVSDSVREYVEKKIGKYRDIFQRVVSRIDVECSGNLAARGVDSDFKVEITAYLPKKTIRIEKSGADVYGLIDKASDVLIKEVKKYKGKIRMRIPKGKVVPLEKVRDVEGEEFIAYFPKVSKVIKVKDVRPVSSEEAIEKMELANYKTFLFMDIDTGFPSLVYKRKSGGYGLVQLQTKA